MHTDLHLLLESQQRRPLNKLYLAFLNKLIHLTNLNGIPIHKILLFFHDIVLGFTALYITTFLYKYYYEPLFNENILYYVYLFTAPIILLLFKNYGVYQYQVILNKARHTSAILKAFFFSMLALVFISFLFKVPEVLFNRMYIITTFLIFFILFLLIRVIAIPGIFYWLVKAKLLHRNLLIVGIDKLSIDKARSLISSKQSYFNICGFINDEVSSEINSFKNIPVLGNIGNLKRIVQDHHIHDILLCSDCKNEDVLQTIIDECKKAGKPIHIVSSFYNVITQKLAVEEIGRISSFRVNPITTAAIYTEVKRALDVLLSLSIILFLLPLWAVITLLIKTDSKGPLFYKAKMIGKGGKEFFMYKFRSMYDSCSTQPHEAMVRKMILENGGTKKLKNDSRVTPIGRILRKLSFDEFPQLINVLKGDMSLVGPRPCLPYEYDLMKPWQKKRAAVKPGMTGLWQIKGRDEVLFNDQVVLDLYYIEHQSLLFDLEILLDTVPVVIFGRGGS